MNRRNFVTRGSLLGFVGAVPQFLGGRQVGLLDPANLPVAGVEQARKLLRVCMPL